MQRNCRTRRKEGRGQWRSAFGVGALVAVSLALVTAAQGAAAAPASASGTATAPAAGTGPRVINLDDWEDYLEAPTAPSRDRRFKGDDGNAPYLKPDMSAPTAPPTITISDQPASIPANAPAPQKGSDDDRLAAIALEDQSFFQTLAKNPEAWPADERDRRAQRIHDEYWLYIMEYPDDVNATVLYGKLLSRTGQRDAAYAAFQRADELDPNLAVVKQQLGNRLAEDGKYTDALEELNQAAALAPNEPIYHFEIGELLNFYYNEFLTDKIFSVASLNAAMEQQLAKAAALAPGEPGFAWRHAESFYDMLDPDWNAALAAWEALAKTTTNPTELEVIGLHRARVLIELGRLEEARKLLDAPGQSTLASAQPALDAARTALKKRLEAAAAVQPAPAATTAPATAPPAASATKAEP